MHSNAKWSRKVSLAAWEVLSPKALEWKDPTLNRTCFNSSVPVLKWLHRWHVEGGKGEHVMGLWSECLVLCCVVLVPPKSGQRARATRGVLPHSRAGSCSSPPGWAYLGLSSQARWCISSGGCNLSEQWSFLRWDCAIPSPSHNGFDRCLAGPRQPSGLVLAPSSS